MGRVGVIFGGPSPEHDVSILTGLQVARALADSGKDPVAVYWSKPGEFYLVDAGHEAADFVDRVPRNARQLRFVLGRSGGFFLKKRVVELTALVNACHGGPGEDGTLSSALDLAGIRYTGPDPVGAMLGMDKQTFHAICTAAGLELLPRKCFSSDDLGDPGFPGPYILKPRFGGSSIGIEVVEDLEAARVFCRGSVHMRDGVVVEPYIEGCIDLNIGIRTWPKLELSAIERPLRGEEDTLLDYDRKYMHGEGGMAGAAREIPADIPEKIETQIREAAEVVARATSVRSVARLDFLSDGDDVWVNELNTIPGAMGGYLWVDPEIPFTRLIEGILEEAEKAPPRQFSTAGSEGKLLRASGSIASKLT